MRVNFIFFLGLGFLVLAGAFFAFQKRTDHSAQRSVLGNIPDISISDLDGRAVSFESLLEARTNVLIYFNSNCPICQSEVELLVKHFKSDSTINFIWISSEPIEAIRSFEGAYDLGLLHHVTVASDTLYQVASHFKFTSVPATVVYSKHGTLIDFFKGAVSMQDLKRAIQKAHDSKP
ncbi:MAG: protein-disulfide isomerase [Algoriphagus sp.]|jgi:protein-disulfide isomerase